MVSGTKEATQEVLSAVSRSSPDWFLESEQVIRPVLEKRHQQPGFLKELAKTGVSMLNTRVQFRD